MEVPPDVAPRLEQVAARALRVLEGVGDQRPAVSPTMGTVRRRLLRFVTRMKTVMRSWATSARSPRQDSPQQAPVATMKATRAAWSGSRAPSSMEASWAVRNFSRGR